MPIKVIVSALIEDEGRFLFIRQNKQGGAYPNTLHIPGGKLEEGEDPVSAIEREIKEETGITVANIRAYDFDYDVIDYKGAPTQMIFLRFLANHKDGKAVPSSDACEILWIERENLLNYPHNPPSIRLLTKIGLI